MSSQSLSVKPQEYGIFLILPRCQDILNGFYIRQNIDLILKRRLIDFQDVYAEQ
ncbi:MAG TPA: hypothetical protein V6D50_15465 [Chroococcales cyanobacterium]